MSELRGAFVLHFAPDVNTYARVAVQINQGCINPVRLNYFYCDAKYAVYLAPRILKSILDFWKVCAPPGLTHL